MNYPWYQNETPPRPPSPRQRVGYYYIYGQQPSGEDYAVRMPSPSNTPVHDFYQTDQFDPVPLDPQPTNPSILGSFDTNVDGSSGLEKQSANDIRMRQDDSTSSDSVWSQCHGSPIYLENVGYEVDYVVPSISKNPFAKKKKAHKIVLQDVTTHAGSTELMAIMGASGSGKTTMLNVMAYRIRPTSGEVYLNGQPVSGVQDYQRHIAYVMQDDVLMETLSVLECLRFAARLKLTHLDKDSRAQRVKDVLEQLGLTHVQDTVIGSVVTRGISGGERKRTSIAVELLSRPSILFLDEPTSGLDSFTAESVIGTCKKLADHGHTVVATVHQPNSDTFRLFSTVLFLAKGQVVYSGPREGTVEYFRLLGYDCPQYTNPPDYFMKLLRSDVSKDGHENTTATLKKDLADIRSDEFIQSWRSHMQQYVPEKDPPGSLDPPPPLPKWILQFRALFWRAFINISRNKLLTRARFAQSIILGLFFGLIFLRLGHEQVDIMARMGAIFFALINQSMPAITGIVHTFPSEKAVLTREHANGMYTLLPYYLSKLFGEVIFQIILPVIFCAIFYYLVNLNPGPDHFFIFALLVVLVCICAASLGLLISALASSVAVALAVAPSIMMPFILFAGFFTPGDALPVWCFWMKYIDFFYYAFAATMVNEFKGQTFTCEEAPCFETGEDVLRRWDFENANIWMNCAIIAAFAIAFQLFGFLALVRATRKSSSGA